MELYAMKYRKNLLIVSVCSVFLGSGIVIFVRTAHSQNLSRVPFTVEQTEVFYRYPAGDFGAQQNSTHGVRTDGSEFTCKTVKAPDGTFVKQSIISKDVIDALPTGKSWSQLGMLTVGVTSSTADVGGTRAQSSTVAGMSTLPTRCGMVTPLAPPGTRMYMGMSRDSAYGAVLSQKRWAPAEIPLSDMKTIAVLSSSPCAVRACTTFSIISSTD